MRVIEAFRAAFGADPQTVWHAPGRVNLIGEHTDYNDGFVLPFAVPWGVTAAITPRADRTIRVLSLQSPDTAPVTIERHEDATGWTRYVVGVFDMLGDRVPAADLLRLGIATEVTGDARVLDRARELAATIAGFPADGVAAIKSGMRAASTRRALHH